MVICLLSVCMKISTVHYGALKLVQLKVRGKLGLGYLGVIGLKPYRFWFLDVVVPNLPC